jgi:serine protease inhibitor
MITEVLTPEEFTPQAVSYLLNATYFKGAWAAKFDKVFRQSTTSYLTVTFYTIIYH